MSSELDFNWAKSRWTDPLSGTEVVCLSPPDATTHFRNNYFRCPMTTQDGRYLVMYESTGIDPSNGHEIAPYRLWAVDTLDGQMHDLGEVDEYFLPFGGGWGMWETAPAGNRLFVWERLTPDASGLMIIDIPNGQRRTVQPDRPIHTLWGVGYSHDGRFGYTVCCTEKQHLLDSMEAYGWGEMMMVQPGLQEVIQIDLETGGTGRQVGR